MKGSDIITALERFFFDIIGMVIPGLAVIYMLAISFGGVGFLDPFMDSTKLNKIAVGCAIALGYVLGYLLLSVSQWLFIYIDRITFGLRKLRIFIGNKLARKSDKLMPKQGTASRSELMEVFIQLAQKEFPTLCNISDREWRNFALSFAPESAYLTHRFMFISLLNKELAAGNIIVGLSIIVMTMLSRWGWVASSLNTHIRPGTLVAIMFISAWLFSRIQADFNRRSNQLPFGPALVRLMHLIDERQKSNNLRDGASNKK